ncbi:MAG TPA: TIM-barrel domain-containing protein [Solirubrobacteraceae bacterium]|nr:TIM-barrel domain-containing protein [Solirubrobacteraceae bacterium]
MTTSSTWTRRTVGAAIAAALVLAAPAAADVRVEPDRVVVATDGATATIERAPLRLSFTGADGAVALQQVPNARAAPFPIPPAPDPEPIGTDNVPRRPALYAPLTFTAGVQRSFEYPAAQWNGNVLTGVEGGAQHSARDVESVTVEGDVARLVVATSDSGRKLEVTVGPGPGRGTIRVSARVTPDDGVVAMADSFVTREGQPFRGFGGRHNALDQRGTAFYNWLEQENVGAGQLQPLVNVIPGTEREQYLFPNGPHAAYYVQSLFLSDAYGFLLDRPELSFWRMAADREDAWQVSVAAAGLDYVVAPGGDPLRLTAATGRHRVPPAWAVGTQLDRAVRYPNDDPAGYEAQVRDDLAQIDRTGLPLDAYRIEGWEFFSRDTLRELIGELRRRGIHPVLYFRAFVGKDEIGTDDPADFDEAVEKGYVAKTPSGQPYIFISNFQAPAALIDFSNPEAVAWWQGRIREALELGATGFMQDFGEQVQSDMVFHDGSTGAAMHNRYPLLYHRATRALLDDLGRDDVVFYTRAGYSGLPGSAADESSNFPGDETTDWTRSSGLASLTPDMLNRGVGGLFGYMTDIGGYFDIGPYSPTTKELFIRWAEWAALSPQFRLHGSVGAGTHTPWSYDEETVQVYNALSRLHLAARRLILDLWREGVETGVPVARPLYLAYPDDAEAVAQDQQWLLGPDVLVAPVVSEGAVGREVYFPRGCWQHPESGARYEGPRRATVDAPLGVLPYFFRCGTRPFEATRPAGDRVRLPRRCRSRRNFVIRLVRPRRRGERIASARVYVNGRRVRTRRARGRVVARVDLRGLPRGRFTVRIVVRTNRGRTYVAKRRYRTCASGRGWRKRSRFA